MSSAAAESNVEEVKKKSVVEKVNCSVKAMAPENPEEGSSTTTTTELGNYCISIDCCGVMGRVGDGDCLFKGNF
jgi:hypothetical protein